MDGQLFMRASDEIVNKLKAAVLMSHSRAETLPGVAVMMQIRRDSPIN
jgi:hypothetical protein